MQQGITHSHCSCIPSKMARPTPPRRYSILTFMIIKSLTPPAVLRACPKHPRVFRVVSERPWLQLRGFAWGEEVAALIGMAPSTLNRHMSQLRHLAAFSWRTTGQGTLIVSFRSQLPSFPHSACSSTILNSQNQELSLPPGVVSSTILSSQI